MIEVFYIQRAGDDGADALIGDFPGKQLYVLFRGEGDVFSFDRRALDGEVVLCGGDACLFSGRDCAACIFPGDALGAAVRFVCAETEIQRKVRVVFQGIVFAEVFMDEAAGFPCGRPALSPCA